VTTKETIHNSALDITVPLSLIG